MGLRRQHNALVAALPGRTHQCIQHRRSYAPAPPCFEHRHAPNVAVRQQAARADRPAFRTGDYMHANGIVLIQLDLGGDFLLVHEHSEADRPGFSPRFLPSHDLRKQHG